MGIGLGNGTNKEHNDVIVAGLDLVINFHNK
jgi:hypothetical protein